MIGLLGMFLIFFAAGFVIMRYLQMQRRELWAFTFITCIGFILWLSIIVKHPLDLNKAIGWMIESIQ